MSKELIFKKAEQLKELIAELARLLETTPEQFVKDMKTIRAAERNFELMVEVASDINTQIIIERGGMTPDTYRESFSRLQKTGVLPDNLTDALTESAKIRNILVHEYDFEEDYEKFYYSAKKLLPAYHEYMSVIYAYIKK